jgi:hypothetical protein
VSKSPPNVSAQTHDGGLFSFQMVAIDVRPPDLGFCHVAECEHDVRDNSNPKSIRSDVRDWRKHADHSADRDYERDYKYPHFWCVKVHGFLPFATGRLAGFTFDGSYGNPSL